MRWSILIPHNLHTAFAILSHIRYSIKWAHQALMCLQVMCGCAAWPGHSLSANRIIRYYRMYEWKTKARMILCACAGWSESAYNANFRRCFFFAWHGPYNCKQTVCAQELKRGHRQIPRRPIFVGCGSVALSGLCYHIQMYESCIAEVLENLTVSSI